MDIEQALSDYEFVTYTLSFLTAPLRVTPLDMLSTRLPARYTALIWLLFIQFMTLYGFAIAKLLRWAEGRYETS
jgi:hypothetical protein